MASPYVQMSEVLNEWVFIWPYTPAFPILVLTVGIVVRSILPNSVFDSLKSSAVFSESNILNRIFADHGLLIFTLLYLLVSFTRIISHFTRGQNQPLLPSNSTPKLGFKQKAKELPRLLFDTLARYLVILGGLCVLSELKMKTLASHETFVISGHFMGLTIFCVCLIFEVRSSDLHKIFEVEIQEWSPRISMLLFFVSGVLVLCTLGLLIWGCVMLVTAVFYHTLGEKVAGLALGYATPIVTYSVAPLLVNELCIRVS